jgi:dephospho-CoA kinase
LLFIDAYIETRYERMVKRARDAESVISFKEFAESERKEVAAGNNDEDYNQVAIQNMADKTINNSGDLETLYQVSLEYLQKFN